MSYWFSSYIPQLPSINLALPSSIQRRFVSFALKKSLGHFLKPGQLDVEQVDSQLGSGFVQVNDLALDNEAINSFLSGLPLRLTEGSISSVTAKVPWPNPLTSTIGLSLNSLHLELELTSCTNPPAAHNLAESVTSVAESFIHDELTPREEASLRESIMSASVYSDVGEEQNVPGGMNPFMTEDEIDGAKWDTDPAGVSIFATIIERILARFEFDATDLRFTISLPEQANLTLSVSRIQYRTESPEADGGQSRYLSVEGFTIHTCDLWTPGATTPTASSTPRVTLPRSSSPLSSSSSVDDVQMDMSQSLAFLPPRVASPASSVASSMYQSAISTYGATEEPPAMHPITASSLPTIPVPVPPAERSRRDDLIFSMGSDLTVIRLTTPPFASSPAGDGRMRLSVSCGVMACALRPSHLRGILAIADVWASHLPPAAPPTEHTTPSGMSSVDHLQGSLTGRGIVALILPPGEQDCDLIESQFFAHPLTPPQLHHGYLRLHLDNISGSFSSDVVFENDEKTRQAVGSKTSEMLVSFTELSSFLFVADVSSPQTSLRAFPILITDPHLPEQYAASHVHPTPHLSSERHADALPSFEVVDWLDDKHIQYGVKLSQWRVRSRAKSRHSGVSQVSTSPALPPTISHLPAINISLKQALSKKRVDSKIDISTLPLHVFVDAGVMLNEDNIQSFLREAFPSRPVSSPVSRSDSLPADPSEYEESRSATPRLLVRRLSTERQRLERMRQPDAAQEMALNVPMVRVQIYTPPPPGADHRVGFLVLDMHQISVRNGHQEDPHTRFGHSDAITGNELVRVECRRIVAALSLADHSGTVATSVGFRDQALATLCPRVVITTSETAGSPSARSTTALSVDLPSLHMHFTKPILDGLQYFIDDLAQLFERVFGSGSCADDKSVNESVTTDSSRGPSVIGSRYFARSQSGTDSRLSDSPDASATEFVVKMGISEAFVRLMLPRLSESSTLWRPFDVSASDVDVLLELQPEGKDETVVTVGIMDLTVKNQTASGVDQTFLKLTTPRGLTSSSRPLLKLRFVSLTIPDATAKESRIKTTMWGFTATVFPEFDWLSDIVNFVKSPPGAFESVVPSERTRISLKIVDGSIRALAPNHPGAMVVHVGELDFATDLVGASPEFSFSLSVPSSSLLVVDDIGICTPESAVSTTESLRFWKALGYALLAEVGDLRLKFNQRKTDDEPDTNVVVDGLKVHLHLCADSLSAVTAFTEDLSSVFRPPLEERPVEVKAVPTTLTINPISRSTVFTDEFVSKRVPEVGPTPDMIDDDLPMNPDYLDASFGAAAGLREIVDEDLNDFNENDFVPSSSNPPEGLISRIGGETIRLLRPEGLHFVEHHFDTLPPISSTDSLENGDTTLRIRVHDADITLRLYDGYDWERTRKTIEERVREMRRRLAKIRQLVANGHTYDPTMETSALLFNSVYLGLDRDIDDMEPGEIIAAIDEELKDDIETATQSSWQTLPAVTTMKTRQKSVKVHGKRLKRSKGPTIEFCLMGLEAEVDNYISNDQLASRTLVTIRDVEILDHIKTSTWKKFLSALRTDSRGNIRESDSDMVRVELRNVIPVPGNPSQETRLRAKILPLRLHVDQDALDCLKHFFSFKDANEQKANGVEPPSQEIYFQLAEIFPVDLKLDYKPRRVDYRALRAGRTIELMNFFHFDGAEMTLRHITLSGITGWPRLFDMLNDLWTPDVKATQLVDVISGVAPIRSVVNVGSGVADLVLLPIAQYKKDGRIVRGVQKGTKAFVKSTAIEAIKLGARLATGTQVILEQAEGVLGGGRHSEALAGQFHSPVTAEIPFDAENQPANESGDESEDIDQISKYAEQPTGIADGVQSAYRSLSRNFNSAAQTILAVPMEVYERSGNEGPVRSVIRAVPIAVLKPMIGASEAVSKTLLGLHNTLDPTVREDIGAKYKQR
ncbi:hypothetical protein FISHEDRAFT_53048 [Fistulina hepatica ATCC 64428]|nr:hypothetical protein FISHEDRAFT_53048 [Fistulina hepatica ATCC 64428]